MAANLQGIRFDQIYTDNSGQNGSEQSFDTDGDGTATQEDEFISISNTTDSPMDLSGWQIWSDSTGTNAPDAPQDGLFHTFPSGTVLQPGETLYIINEISGATPDWAQEASSGGLESGAGGTSTNFLSEGNSGSHSESVALVNPATGDYIVFNMSSEPSEIEDVPGFPGTNNVGTEDGHSVMADPTSGYSYRYNPMTDEYDARAVSVPCFVSGTLILTPGGQVPVERLRVGDLVSTQDSGAQAIRWIGSRQLTSAELAHTRQHPIAFKPGSLGPGLPARMLCVSPQHRILMEDDVFAPARGLTGLPRVRVMSGCRGVTYHHIMLTRHEVIFAEGVKTESLLPGPTFLSGCRLSDRMAIARIAKEPLKPARLCLSVSQARRHVQRQTVLA